MAKNTTRLGSWTARIGIAAVALVAAMAALPLYLSATATPVHPQPQNAPSVAQADPSPAWSGAVERARQAVRAALAEQNVPGLSVAVGAGGDVVWAEGFGWAQIDERVPVRPDTQFKIGTASTVLTSAAAGVLLEQGRLNLDQEIQAYVPQFPKKQAPVTLRQVMGHTAGINSDSGGDGPLFRQRCEGPGEALRHFADDDLLFEPGTQFAYSKYGWILVSAAIEAAAGRPLLDFMREQLFQPLGMAGTGVESPAEENPDRIGEPAEDAPFLTLFHDVVLEPWGIARRSSAVANRAMFYSPGLGREPIFRHRLHAMRPHNMSCYAGSMAFLSTPSDLVRFGLALNGGTLLQPSTVQLLQTSQQLPSGQETGYGLGWDLETVTMNGTSTPAAGHDGELLGRTVMSFRIFPERGIVVAVAANVSYGDTSALALRVAEAFATR